MAGHPPPCHPNRGAFLEQAKEKKMAKKKQAGLKTSTVAYAFYDPEDDLVSVTPDPPEIQTTTTTVDGKVKSTEVSLTSSYHYLSLCDGYVKKLFGRRPKANEVFKLDISVTSQVVK